MSTASAVLIRKAGPYAKGWTVTTDPDAPRLSERGRSRTVRVDEGRFESWAEKGFFQELQEPEEATE